MVQAEFKDKVFLLVFSWEGVFVLSVTISDASVFADVIFNESALLF